MNPEDRSLPLYTYPPVVETVLGVQFLPLTGFSLPYLGLLWSHVKDQYPTCQIKPPIDPTVEQFEEKLVTRQTGRIELLQEPEVRCWFIGASGNHLIQVQKDRFHFNWRKVTGQEIYPQYDTCKSTFGADWKTFNDFLRDEKLPLPQITQCEVTYVNHIQIGKGWNTVAELDKVVTALTPASQRTLLKEPEYVSLNYRYAIPGKKGRLHIEVKPAIRREDGNEILQLQLTARGKPVSSQTDDIFQWLDLGHEWIVKGFTDFTTEQMHNLWGRNS